MKICEWTCVVTFASLFLADNLLAHHQFQHVRIEKEPISQISLNILDSSVRAVYIQLHSAWVFEKEKIQVKSPGSSREFSYLRKWVPIALLIGAVSGIGSILFYEAIKLSSTYLLGDVGGFFPPSPIGEGASLGVLSSHIYLIPVITTIGGLLSGIIVYGFAPEAEGHGTDAAIDAFHNKKGEIRSRIPLVKLVASAITIGSGGSAGREGPTAQIGAGFGSFLGRKLHLSLKDRRIAVAVGIGAGIGSIFKAPFGGAILSTEILYMGDFEVEALLPAFIASTVGYSIFASYTGWTPVFGYLNLGAFSDPIDLPFYAVLGILCGLVGIVYVKSFYGTRDAFSAFENASVLEASFGRIVSWYYRNVSSANTRHGVWLASDCDERQFCLTSNYSDSDNSRGQNSCYITNSGFRRQRRSLCTSLGYRRLAGRIALDIVGLRFFRILALL